MESIGFKMRIVAGILLCFCLGCHGTIYINSSNDDIPSNKDELSLYIISMNAKIEQSTEELKEANKDVEFHKQYLLQNPDTAYDHQGSRALSSAKFHRDFKRAILSSYKEKLNIAKEKLEKLEKEEKWINSEIE